MNIVQSYMTNNPCYKAGRKINVRKLMLHSVGCPQPSANVFINQMNKSSYSRACVHAFIDANTGVVYQTLPWNHRGWHGGGSSNDTHIGVEMCEPAEIRYTGGSTFTCSNKTAAKEAVKRTYDSAVELFAKLCKDYDLNPLTDICSHKEGHRQGIASNHGDPEHLWNGLGMGYTMDGFRKDVKAAMDDVTIESPEPKQNEWVHAADGRWWYRHADGSYTTNGWELINGKWYLFDSAGWMLTGWQQVKETWYYLLPDGAMTTGWVKLKDQWYHLSDSGSMDTGLFQDKDGRLYYLAPDGHMCRTNESGALA